MKQILLLFLFIVSPLLSWSDAGEEYTGKTISPKATSCTVELNVQGVIGLSNLQRVISAKTKANKSQCGSILLLMNTPGGSLDSTRKIVTEILNSEIPFLCLVYPSGAHAGSAGAIILQACHMNGAMRATAKEKMFF